MSDWIEVGRAVVANGDLRRLRKELGLNRSSMAELLQTSVVTYTLWERKRGLNLWPVTAARIGRFYTLARSQLTLLDLADVPFRKLVPLHHMTTVLGAPQELLLKRYREGRFDAEDLGILGLWLYRDDLERIRESL